MVRAQRLDDPATNLAPADPAAVSGYLEDASGTGPGRAAALYRPGDAAEAAQLIRRSNREGFPLLFQAARSSLTAGAVPQGEVLLSVERMARIDAPVVAEGAVGQVRVEAGVRLIDLQRELTAHGLYYPPVPTYQQAMVGGVLATNAGGAASFKYGNTRRWVRGLELLLFNGDLLRLERGEALARAGESFMVELSDGARLPVPAPTYRLPELPKLSAGYHAAEPLDLVDLFVGSEGTLGLIVAATLELARLPPSVLVGLSFLHDNEQALALAGALRHAAVEARRLGDARGPDVRAIEWIDARGLDLLREARASGAARPEELAPAPGAGSALLFEVELPEAMDAETAAARLAGGAGSDEGPLERLAAMLGAHEALEGTQLALPGDAVRQRALRMFREAVPVRVNEKLASRRRDGGDVAKVGGDLIVPFERLGEAIAIYEAGFRERGLEFAIWGHLSDGNLHPNAIPRNSDEALRAADAMHEFADAAIRLGGAPLAEHGVGRSRLKQQLLRRFLGDEAIASMQRVKRALDPHGRLAPGVLLPARGASR